MAQFYSLVSLVLLAFHVKPLMVIIDARREYCIHKDIKHNDTIKISYINSGEQEDNIQVLLKGPSGEGENNTRLFYDNKPNGIMTNKEQFDIHVQKEGTYSLCFQSFSQTSTTVSFEYFTMNESGHILSIAKDEVFGELYKNVTTISYLFEEIEQNLKFDVERRGTHAKLITKIILLVQKACLYKIIIVIMLSLFQVYLITKFIRKKKSECANLREQNTETVSI